MRGPLACRHLSEDRWVRGGSKVGENGGPHGYLRGMSALFCLIIKFLLFVILCAVPHREFPKVGRLPPAGGHPLAPSPRLA